MPLDNGSHYAFGGKVLGVTSTKHLPKNLLTYRYSEAIFWQAMEAEFHIGLGGCFQKEKKKKKENQSWGKNNGILGNTWYKKVWSYIGRLAFSLRAHPNTLGPSEFTPNDL